MNDTQQHIIKRQIIEIKLPNQKEANYWQDYFMDLYKREVLPMIDEYCSSISTSDEVITIDSLELDLGKIDIQNPNEFVRKVKNSLKEKLFRKCLDARNQKSNDVKYLKITPAKNSFFNSKKSSILKSNDGGIQPDDFSKTNKALSQIQSQELLIYFIKNGNLPWWNSNKSLHNKILFHQLENATPEYLKNVKPLLQYSACRKRILYGLPQSARKEFLIKVFPESKQSIEQLKIFFQKYIHAFSKTDKKKDALLIKRWDKNFSIPVLENMINILLEKLPTTSPNYIFTKMIIEELKFFSQIFQIQLSEIISKTKEVIWQMNFQSNFFELEIKKELSNYISAEKESKENFKNNIQSEVISIKEIESNKKGEKETYAGKENLTNGKIEFLSKEKNELEKNKKIDAKNNKVIENEVIENEVIENEVIENEVIEKNKKLPLIKLLKMK